ncbi:hypothetical protein ED312_08525 [Sinomicrobium pectinilyticum]|uniref:Uncharacterized protein n=1 Tax=Sinomicrobium pectinilyticum TaxID=1084421 RepID=A0A3N0EKP7_SINP1|nr:hypothetical protein ED312_08525 [Sinomicrobium pectinilyticum]
MIVEFKGKAMGDRSTFARACSAFSGKHPVIFRKTPNLMNVKKPLVFSSLQYIYRGFLIKDQFHRKGAGIKHKRRIIKCVLCSNMLCL